MASPTYLSRYSGASSDEEAKFFRDLMEKFAGRVDSRAHADFRFGEDRDGRPAVWVTLYAPSDLGPDPLIVGDLKTIPEDIKKEILSSKFERLPYVRIRAE